MLLCWSMLLLCLSARAENVAMFRESGESATLRCSSAGCPSSVEASVGMYLYQDFQERQEVLYYHPKPESKDKVTPRQRHKDRIETSGSLRNHTITIRNLSVEDAGVYSCVYVNFPHGSVSCSAYTLVVRGVPCAPIINEESPPLLNEESPPLLNEESPPLLLLIITASAISTAVTMIFTLLILPRVKEWVLSRRRRRVPVQEPNDYVYEVMRNNTLRPLAAPQPSPPNPYAGAVLDHLVP